MFSNIKKPFCFKINISNGVISDKCHTLLTSIDFVVLFEIIIKKNATDFLRLHAMDIDVIFIEEGIIMHFIDNLLDHSILDVDVA